MLSRTNEEKQRSNRVDVGCSDLRILPSFVVDAVEDGGFLVSRVGMLVFEYLCLIEEFVVKAEYTLVFAISREVWRSHSRSQRS